MKLGITILSFPIGCRRLAHNGCRHRWLCSGRRRRTLQIFSQVRQHRDSRSTDEAHAPVAKQPKGGLRLELNRPRHFGIVHPEMPCCIDLVLRLDEHSPWTVRFVAPVEPLRQYVDRTCDQRIRAPLYGRTSFWGCSPTSVQYLPEDNEVPEFLRICGELSLGNGH